MLMTAYRGRQLALRLGALECMPSFGLSNSRTLERIALVAVYSFPRDKVLLVSVVLGADTLPACIGVLLHNWQVFF